MRYRREFLVAATHLEMLLLGEGCHQSPNLVICVPDDEQPAPSECFTSISLTHTPLLINSAADPTAITIIIFDVKQSPGASNVGT